MNLFHIVGIGEELEVLAHFPYSTSRILSDDRIFETGSDRGDDFDTLHRELADRAKVYQDNKQSFVIKKGNTIIGVNFHDWQVSFGYVTTCIRGLEKTEAVGWDKLDGRKPCGW